jgi:hypothetical protein
MKLDFSQQIFEKNIKISNFMKVRPVGAELFHADRQTDMTKLIVAFRNFANARINAVTPLARSVTTISLFHRAYFTYSLLIYPTNALHLKHSIVFA